MTEPLKKFEFIELDTTQEANMMNPEQWVFVGLKGNSYIFKRRKKRQ